MPSYRKRTPSNTKSQPREAGAADRLAQNVMDAYTFATMVVGFFMFLLLLIFGAIFIMVVFDLP